MQGEPVRRLFDLEADVLYRRYTTIETLLPARDKSGALHAPEEGHHIEALLRDFLNRHLPRQLRAYSGFIYRPVTKQGAFDKSRFNETDAGDVHSGQLDVIVFDRSTWPIYEEFGEVAIVPPEGVIGIVSVKKTLYCQQLDGEFKALLQALDACSKTPKCSDDREVLRPYTALFAFRSNPNEAAGRSLADAIYSKVKSAYSGRPFSSVVNEVSVLEQFTVFKERPRGDRLARFTFVQGIRDDGQSGPSGYPLQRMLQSIMAVYYNRMGRQFERPGYVSFLRHTFSDAPELGLLPVSEDPK